MTIEDSMFMSDRTGRKVGKWKLKRARSGELLIRGPQAMIGYLNDKALNARTLKSCLVGGQGTPAGQLRRMATGAGITVSKPLLGVVDTAVR